MTVGSNGTVGMENGGVPFGKYEKPDVRNVEFKAKDFVIEANLEGAGRNDTRFRVHNVQDHGSGTFNMRDPGHGAQRGIHPRNTYEASQAPDLAYTRSIAELQCRPVKGGRVTDFYDNWLSNENNRKFGALPRTASASNLTIKDQVTYYVGQNPNHYGGCCGTFNQSAYHDEYNLTHREPGAYGHRAKLSKHGQTRTYQQLGPDAISFARPGRSSYNQDNIQFGRSKLFKKGHQNSRCIDWKFITNDLRSSSNGQ